jgi:hypothetical protein
MIERVALSPMARQVKLAELADSLDQKREVPADLRSKNAMQGT